MYKLIIADDHPVIREGLKAYLLDSKSFSLEGVASSADELLRMIPLFNPDVIMTDLDMPGSSTFDVLKKIKEDFPNIKKVVFTFHEEKSFFLKSVEASINGYILKSEPFEMISPLLLSIMEGGFAASPKMQKYLIAHSKDSVGYDSLTPREKEVLAYIARGYSNIEIAEKFNLSVRTIEFHKNNIKEKLNMKSLAEIIKYYESLNV
ncbi:MAG TPA: response regulator transcription factor [Leptospiraceae bacterium]|nr:response regulator transcription factor [Leptospiraceae bacterium]HMW03943.1 response regulator transcription factor [Leptospiraceae bacterium]HMX33581.1 response regulator transcription factor [Leptospiraceae bacterium]HMY29923.1 response regulator transcription factor [Leptospiraceae bacterium]HMZ67123.1 response regulator transcription factor [Leptospiraceae bacterium]